MLQLSFDKPADLDYFAERVAAKLYQLQAQPEPEDISFKEAMSAEVLGISYSTLQRRLDAAHVKSFWKNGGKCFKRKELNKLRR